jgi:hypothetical protein
LFKDLTPKIFKYSFTSNLKAYQEINDKGDVVNLLYGKRLILKLLLLKENVLLKKMELLMSSKLLSELKTGNLTRVEIKTVKNKAKYDIELTLINNGEFFFLIKNDNKIKLYKFCELNKK